VSTRWKETAWNGIRFHTPADWDIAKIGKQYLLFEDEDRPALEIKWNTIKGTFSHKKHLRRLTALHGKKDAHHIEQWKIPDPWAQALRKYEIAGFSWESSNLNGNGAILYCSECGNATFIQFYHKDSEIDGGLTTHILKSFRDHDSKEQTQWSIYDIRAYVPKTLRLDRYRFEPGNFLLVFLSHGRKITLHRWSPAHALLSDSDLSTVAVSRIPELSGAHLKPVSNEPDVLEWESRAEDTAWSRWRNRILKKSSYQWFRIRHEKEKNRILAIQAEDRKPTNQTLLRNIFENYESL
jgi:hypothetical protein